MQLLGLIQRLPKGRTPCDQVMLYLSWVLKRPSTKQRHRNCPRENVSILNTYVCIYGCGVVAGFTAVHTGVPVEEFDAAVTRTPKKCTPAEMCCGSRV